MDHDFSLVLEGMSVDEVYQQAIKANLPASDAAILVSSWIFQNFGKTKRTFNYVQAFAAVDDHCTPTFEREFEHTDWTDGESVVQAESTPGEVGFNARFHHIEADLDNLNKDVRTLFECVAELRLSLRGLLDELRAEINRINSDLFDLDGDDSGGSLVVQRPPYAQLIDQNQFLGTAIVNEKPLGMWQTPQGVIMLPQTFVPGLTPDDRRLNDSAGFATFIQDQRVKDAYDGEEVTKEDLIDRFGNELTRDGVLVRELLKVLPDGAKYDTLDAMYKDLAERNAAIIRSTPGASGGLVASLGIMGAVTGEIGEASISGLATTPANVRVALQRQGFDTIGGLADASVEKIVDALKTEGLQFSNADAAALQATAFTLARVGRVGP